MKRLLVFLGVSFLLCDVALPQETKCTDCHAVLKEGDKNVTPQEIDKSIHSKNSVNCISCHGDDKFDEAKPNPHLMAKSFKGKPRQKEIAEFCGACHKLELENFAKSRHHAESKRGIMKECISCHGYHTVAEPGPKDFINFCIKCHKGNSLEYRQGAAFMENFESKDAELMKVSREISDIKDIPGVDTSSIEISKSAAIERIAMLRKIQHSMEASNTKDDFGLISKMVAKADMEIAERQRSIVDRKVWLSVFIFVIFLAIALVNLKYRNHEKSNLGDSHL